MNLKSLSVRWFKWVLLLLVMLGLSLTFVATSHAAANQVGCDVNALINAINTANASVGADTLELSAGCSYALTAINNTDETYGPNGLPVITGDLTLNGNGATITRAEGAPKFRFFQIQSGVTLSLNQLTLKKGELAPTSQDISAYQGGAIYNLGTLALSDCVMENNWAHEAGGGIYNDGGSVTVTQSTFSKNGENWAVIATVHGGAIYSQNGTVTATGSEFRGNLASYEGGAIYSEGSLDVAESRFMENITTLQGGRGGGAVFSSGNGIFAATTFDGNDTNLYGGALHIEGTAEVSDSVFVRNGAWGAHGSGGGGAIYGPADVLNSTFYDNAAGIYANGAAILSGGTVVNSTFSSNVSEGGFPYQAGISGALLKNSILLDTLCHNTTDGGGNIYWPKSNYACPGTLGNPRLGQLQDNGGATETMAPGVDSAALDAAVAVECPLTDQRGVSRPQGVSCDIGAIELGLSTIDQNDSTVTFGRWHSINIGGAAMRVSNHQDDTVAFTFKGRKIKWHTWRGPNYGMAQVTIDDRDKGTIDLYSQFPVQGPDRTLIFSKLGSGKHRIVIRVLGEKNPAATDTNVALDKFVVGGNTTLANAAKISFNNWKSKTDPLASGGTYRASGDADARAEFSFSGPGIQWLTATGPAYGKARVFIDGTQRGGTFDLYSPTPVWRVAIPFGGLSEGQHTFVVVALGSKNPLSAGTRVVIDGFRLPLLPGD